MIYLDSAATSLQKPQSVSQSVSRAIKTLASPGRGCYAGGGLCFGLPNGFGVLFWR